MQDELNQATNTLAASQNTLDASLPQEFFYHIPWRSRSVQAGSHKTKLRGAGSDFSGFASLLECPDPKRLDVRASLRTIPKQLMVRTFFERSAIKVYAVSDVSSSMQFVGSVHKQQVLINIVEAIAWSSTRQGDAFAMLGCDENVQDHLQILPTYRSTAALDARKQLQQHFIHAKESTHTTRALPLSAQALSPQRALVFVISDFHLSDELILETYQAYAVHDVVPIVLWDEAEFEALPSWGLARVQEMETGVERSFFMRPSLLKSVRQYAQNRKANLRKLSMQFGFRPPFFVTNQFDASALTRHLLGA